MMGKRAQHAASLAVCTPSAHATRFVSAAKCDNQMRYENAQVLEVSYRSKAERQKQAPRERWRSEPLKEVEYPALTSQLAVPFIPAELF